MKVYISYNKNRYSDKDLYHLSENIKTELARKLMLSSEEIEIDFWDRKTPYNTNKLHSADLVILLPKENLSGRENTQTVLDKGQETEVIYCIDNNIPILITWGSCIAYFEVYKIYKEPNKKDDFINTATVNYVLRHDVTDYIEELQIKRQESMSFSSVPKYTKSNQNILLILK